MKSESRSEHNPVETKSEEAATIASMLAPLEEQEGADGSGRASSSDNTGELKLPKDFIEDDRQGNGLRLEPAVIFILVLVLGFIAFIAYLISVEPPK